MALKNAVSKTGPMSKNMAMRDTVTSKIKATTLYPIKLDNKKEIAETMSIIAILNTYCCFFENLYRRRLDNQKIV